MGPSLGWALGRRPPAHAPGPALITTSTRIGGEVETQGGWEQQGGRAGFLDGPSVWLSRSRGHILEPVKDRELARR